MYDMPQTIAQHRFCVKVNLYSFRVIIDLFLIFPASKLFNIFGKV